MILSATYTVTGCLVLRSGDTSRASVIPTSRIMICDRLGRGRRQSEGDSAGRRAGDIGKGWDFDGMGTGTGQGTGDGTATGHVPRGLFACDVRLRVLLEFRDKG